MKEFGPDKINDILIASLKESNSDILASIDRNSKKIFHGAV
jgi:hypothetical protein